MKKNLLILFEETIFAQNMQGAHPCCCYMYRTNMKSTMLVYSQLPHSLYIPTYHTFSIYLPTTLLAYTHLPHC